MLYTNMFDKFPSCPGYDCFYMCKCLIIEIVALLCSFAKTYFPLVMVHKINVSYSLTTTCTSTLS